MKKLFMLLTALSITLCLCSCDVQIIIQPKPDEDVKANTETVTKENEVPKEAPKQAEQPKAEQPKPTPPAPQSTRITPEYTSASGVISDAHFSVEIPSSWDGKYSIRGTAHPDKDGYYVSFLSANDDKKGFGGMLFEVAILPASEEYSYLPSYEELGGLTINDKGNYNVVVIYPTDVQFDQNNHNNYISMNEDSSKVIASIQFNSNCTYMAGNMFEVPQQSAPVASDYIFPSDTQYITESDLSWRTKDEIVLMRNEIYARHGYIFNMEKFKAYFGAKSWYSPNPNFSTKMFNKIEQANIDFIVKYEKKMGWK